MTTAATESTGVRKLTFLHPRGGKQFDAEVDEQTTAEQALQELIKVGFLDSPGRDEYVLSIQRTGQTVPKAASLARSGAKDGDLIEVTRTSEGAARLTPAELAGRLAFDFRVMEALASPYLNAPRAFASERDARAGRALTAAEGRAGRGAIYLVEYRFPMAKNPTERLVRATARFDLLAGGNYPFSPPAVQMVSAPIPFSNRVHAQTGAVCTGSVWSDAEGEMLLAQLVVHAMRLLNFDEPSRGAPSDTFNAVALEYWRRTLGGAPLNPGFDYPTLPPELTHAVRPPRALFRPAAPSCPGRFAASGRGCLGGA